MLDTSFSGRGVVRELGDLIAERGRQKMIVSDNGTELTSNAVQAWAMQASSGTISRRASRRRTGPSRASILLARLRHAAFAAELKKQRAWFAVGKTDFSVRIVLKTTVFSERISIGVE